MEPKEPINTLPKLAYVNFFPSPHFLDKEAKLIAHRNAFDFLFSLKDYFQITVFDYIGVSCTFKKQEVVFNYIKNTSTSKFHIPWVLLKKIRKLEPAIVYVQGLAFPHYIVLLNFFLKANTKIIVHDHANSISGKLKYLIFKWADSYTCKYLFTSKELAKPWLKKGLISSEDKIVECVEGSTHFKFNSKLIKKKNLFIWVGRMDENKDPITVLIAFKNYLNSTDATLVMFYKEAKLLKEVKQFIRANSLEKSIILKGTVENKDLEIWYQKSSYFILGSHKEGGPFSLVEAMACGCIPIVTNIPAFKTMTDEGRCGFLFEPGNAADLHQQFLNLNKSAPEELRNTVLQQFENELSHRAIALKIKKAALS